MLHIGRGIEAGACWVVVLLWPVAIRDRPVMLQAAFGCPTNPLCYFAPTRFERVVNMRTAKALGFTLLRSAWGQSGCEQSQQGNSLLNHLVGKRELERRNFEAQRLGCL